MKIKTKFLGIIYIIVLIFGFSMSGIYFYLHTSTDKSINNIRNYGNELEIVSRLELALVRTIMPANDYLIHGNKEEKSIFEELKADADNCFSMLEEDTFHYYTKDEGREFLNRLKDQYAQIKVYSEMIFNLSNPIGNRDGAYIMEKMDLLMDDMLNDMKELHDRSQQDVLIEIEVIKGKFYRYMIMVLIVFLGIIVILIMYGMFMTKGIIGPIVNLAEYMKSVATGDFSKKLVIKSNDEIGCLASAFSDMTFRLEESRKQLLYNTYRLEESEEKFRKIADLAQDSIIMLNNDEEVSYWNKAAEKTFGYSEEEILGKNLHKIIIPDKFRKRHLEGFEKFKSNGQGRFIGKTLELSAIRRDGTEFPVELSISAVELNNKWNAIAIIRDVTRRKQLEKISRLSQKMSSIGRLTASVFHEILNPVNIISSHLQLLLMEAEKGSKTEEDLKSIQDEIGRIVKIADELKKFSKKEDTKAEEVEVNGLLENTLSLIEPEMKLRNIKVIRTYERELPKTMADGNELKQVFLNLITNAYEAMPDGGTHTVKTRSVRQASDLKGDFIEITFEDTGCGIASNDIDKVFEPFFSTKEAIKGVGLGLSSSYAIMEGYGGTIRVKSEEGKGTTFTVYLPVKLMDGD